MKIAKRYLAVVLSFALFLALPLAFTQEAAAASKGTKIYQPSLVVSSSTYEGDTSSSMTAFFYNNKGLMSQKVYQNGESTAYVYDKNGYMTSEADLDKDGKPYNQTVYTVKKGKLKASAYYSIDGSDVKLVSSKQYSYKNGKISKEVYSNANGTTSWIATYKNGLLAKYVRVDSDGDQTVSVYDKYGNITSSTYMYKYGENTTATMTTVYKNSYKDGKLVKVSWARNWSTDNDLESGLIVYTYKKGKLVKSVSATTSSWEPGVTDGYTANYAYTKGGLIKTVTWADTRTTATETKITSSGTRAYQYKKVAVNSKCVKAVKEAVEDEYGYENYLPGNSIYGNGIA